MELMDVLYVLLAFAVLFLSAIFIFINAYLCFIHRKYSHLPTPKGAGFYFGHVSIIVNRLKKGAYVMDTFKSWADECGPVYVFWSLHTPIVVVAHPEVVKELASSKHPKPRIGPLIRLWNRQRFMGNSLVLIQNQDEWKDRRRTFDPSFSRHSLENLVPQFNKVVDRYFIDHLRDIANDNMTVDMKEVFSKVTLEVISWVAFGMDCFEDSHIRAICGSQDLLTLINLSMEGGDLHLNDPLLPYIKPFGGYKYTNAVAKLREIGRYCIEKRIETLNNGDECPQDILTQIISLTQKEKNMSIEDLIDDFVTFYMAGQETTSNNLSFALIELLQSPDLLQRLISEINEVIGDNKVIEKHHLDKLEFMQSVIEETLRLHPTATFFDKLTGEDVVTSNYKIPKDTEILFSPYISHRDPEHFENPLQFDQSRFEAGQKRPSPYVYMPFGVGHRSCIGRTFAMMETKVILALLFKNFELTLEDGYVLKKTHAFTSKPANGIPCTVKPKL